MNKLISSLIKEINNVYVELGDNNYSTQLIILGLDEIILSYYVCAKELKDKCILSYDIKYSIKDEKTYTKVQDKSEFRYYFFLRG